MLRQIDIFQGALVKLSNYAFIAKRSKRLDDQPDNALSPSLPIASAAEICSTHSPVSIRQSRKIRTGGELTFLEIKRHEQTDNGLEHCWHCFLTDKAHVQDRAKRQS